MHNLARALQHARHARFADKHMVRFFRQHELRRARQRVKTRLGQRRQLEFAVAIRKKRKHVKRQPIAGFLVEGCEDAWVVRVPRPPCQQSFGFFPSITPEIPMKEIHHRPQMPSLLHINLKQVPEVVKRRTSGAQKFLLFHRGRFRVALGHDDSA